MENTWTMPKLDHHSSEKTVELDHIQADHQASKQKKIELDHLETGPPSKPPKKTRAGQKSKQATQVEVVQLTRETV